MPAGRERWPGEGFTDELRGEAAEDDVLLVTAAGLFA
jgi:hypothetical protein